MGLICALVVPKKWNTVFHCTWSSRPFTLCDTIVISIATKDDATKDDTHQS